MLFYKVKPAFDNRRRLDGSILIADELYTAKEKEKLRVPDAAVEAVSVKKNTTYWLFGARKEIANV